MSRIVDLDAWDWLEPSGDIPRAPAERRRRALLVARCIEYAGPIHRGERVQSLIPCPRRPGNSPCPGLLDVEKEDGGRLRAQCPECGSLAARVRGWESTPWAGGPQTARSGERDGEASARGERAAALAGEHGTAMAEVPAREETASARERARAPRAEAETSAPADDEPAGALPAPAPESAPVEGVDRRLESVLRKMKSTLDAATVRRHIATASAPSKVVELVAGTGAVPDEDALEMLCDALIDAWNHTPRAELGGRTPAQMSRAMTMPADAARMSAPAAVTESMATDAPCLCGSGAPAAQCCAPQFH